MSLLPCPFCGSPVVLRNAHVVGEADYIDHDRSTPLVDCGLDAFSNFATDTDVSELWNTRATLTPYARLNQERDEV